MAELVKPARIGGATVASVAAVAGAAAVLVWASSLSFDTAALPPGRSSSGGVAMLAPDAPAFRDHAAAIDVILSRPLFSPDRKSPAKAQAAPQDAVVEVTELELVGVREDASGQRMALIRQGERQAAWVASGQSLEGWRVARVEPTTVVVEGRGGRVELKLYRGQ